MKNAWNIPAPGPTALQGERQQDGNVSQMGERPTRARLQDRSASPVIANTSGMERALGELADRTHPPKRR